METGEGAWTQCTEDTLPADEACDGRDADCDGRVDESCEECTPSEETCDGSDEDCDGAIDEGCEECTPSEETCDGSDEDCDGAIDEGCPECSHTPELCNASDDDCDGSVDEGVCGTGSCAAVPMPASCERLGALPPRTLTTECRLAMPPASTIPCEVPERGPVYYVSPAGDDSRDGASPTQAWRTLCHATTAAPAGSTIRVAEGMYDDVWVGVDRGLVIKGGWDSGFTAWDPDAYPSIFLGRLTLNHDEAVWGGFRMRGQAPPYYRTTYHGGYHFVSAGALLRNYIELVDDTVDDRYYQYGIVASACAGGVSTIACNDILVQVARGGSGRLTSSSGIEYGNLRVHQGLGRVVGNRICLSTEPSEATSSEVISGYGTCGPASTPARVEVTTNVIESNHDSGAISEFYGCDAADLEVIWTNNTMMTRGAGLTGYEGSTSPYVVRWGLANNIFYGEGGTAPVAVGSGRVEIAWSEHNLAFGFGSNAFSPTPLRTMGDDTSGSATASGTFTASATGDYRPRAAGPAAGSGLNVFGLADYGDVTADVNRSPWPASHSEPWDRGAYRVP